MSQQEMWMIVVLLGIAVLALVGVTAPDKYDERGPWSVAGLMFAAGALFDGSQR